MVTNHKLGNFWIFRCIAVFQLQFKLGHKTEIINKKLD